MTYLEHLINISRLKSALWVFFGGAFAFFVANLATSDLLSITRHQLIGLALTAIVTQLTKAMSNYLGETDEQATPDIEIATPAASQDAMPDLSQD